MVDVFPDRLVAEERELFRIIRSVVPMTMSDRDLLSFANALVCHLCEEPLTEIDKVRNHCPVSYTHLDVYKRQGYYLSK